MEYLINDDQEKAKDILHQLFIEKARAIHEELINIDDDTIPGDDGDELEADVHDHSDHLEDLGDEIDSEENLEEDEDEDEISLDDAVDDISDSPDGDDDDMHDDEKDGDNDGMSMSEIEDTMHDLESAFAELKAEFKALDDNGDGDEDEEENVDNEDVDNNSDDDMDVDDMDHDEDKDDDSMEESEESEDWADLEESLDLDIITSNIYGPGSKSSTEAGSGGKSVNVNTKSPTPSSQKDRFGAKPVDPDKGPTENGYIWKKNVGYVKVDNAPLTGMADNRRRKSTDGMSGVGSSYGKTKDFGSSKLEHDGDFPSDTKNSKSVLTKAPMK